MLKSELVEIIGNGENSGVEFKLDGIRSEQLAKEVVALANFIGGRILIGIAHVGTIHGTKRENLETSDLGNALQNSDVTHGNYTTIHKHWTFANLTAKTKIGQSCF